MLPDFASVNWHEPGAQDVAEALLDRGVGVEAGLWQPAAVGSWRRWCRRDRCLRVLLEVVADHPSEQAVAVAGRLVAALGDVTGETSVLLHGEGTSSWPVLAEAVRRGLDVRIGLEDVLVLRDGSPAESNAQLVVTARGLLDRR
ncbi:MAG: 3-keto-5-aminohexanoate cleavage protein [Mycobacteriaceae bacterium]